MNTDQSPSIKKATSFNDSSEFTFQSHGACGKVTGSCYELEFNNKRFLVDCGFHQGDHNSDELNRKKFPFPPKEISHIFLTHAHMDHCGLIPRLVNEGFTGKVYATKETIALAKINLRDAVKIGEKNKNPLYKKSDVKKIQWRPINNHPKFKWNKQFLLDHTDRQDDLQVIFQRQSHLLGSISINFLAKNGIQEKSIHFSGDIGPNSDMFLEQSLLRPHHIPFRSTDYIVTESTNAAKGVNRNVLTTSSRLQQLETALNRQDIETFLMPAFSIQRTQEVLFDLFSLYKSSRLDSHFEIIIDGRMAQKVNQVYAASLFQQDEVFENYPYLNKKHAPNEGKPRTLNFLQEFIQALQGKYQSTQFSVKLGERNDSTSIDENSFESILHRLHKLNTRTIYLTSNGMCDKGMIVKHIDQHIRNERALLLISGYQSPRSFGHELLHINEDQAADPMTLPSGDSIPKSEVKLQVEKLLGYTGHTDLQGILDYTLPSPKSKDRSKWPEHKGIFITHGGNKERRILKDELEARFNSFHTNTNLEVYRPNLDSGKFDIFKGQWVKDLAQADHGDLLQVLLKNQSLLEEQNHLLSTQLEANALFTSDLLLEIKTLRQGLKIYSQEEDLLINNSFVAMQYDEEDLEFELYGE